jgi:hypothetical protein
MTDKIFCIGWAKTGTTTLAAALRALGYRHQSQDLTLAANLVSNDLAPIIDRAREYESFDDWPWLLLYRELDRAFPDSRFILTTRAPDDWLASYRNMLDAQKPSHRMNQIRRVLYDLPFPYVTGAALRERYQRHNAEVLRYFMNRPADLLVVNWASGHGWAALCAFLGRAVPNAPFPHANKGTYPANRPHAAR